MWSSASQLPTSICACAGPHQPRRYVSFVDGSVSDSGPASVGHGFSALNAGLQAPSGPLVATVEVYPDIPSLDIFPDPAAWETTSPALESGVAIATSGGEGAMVDEATRGTRRLIAAKSPSVAGPGYTRGKWLWEWEIESCGNLVGVGVCGRDVAAMSPTDVPMQGGGGGAGGGGNDSGGDVGVGSAAVDLWMYLSDGHLSRSGKSETRVCPGGGFDGGDVIGVELDADAGLVAFLKNDAYVGAQFKIVRSGSAGSKVTDGEVSSAEAGLYPCVSIRGSGDAVLLLGLKHGSGTVTYRPPPKDGETGKDGGGRDSPSPGGEGIAAALSAAVATANADAEAIAAAAAGTVGGGDAVALSLAESAVAVEQALAARAANPAVGADLSSDAEPSHSDGGRGGSPDGEAASGDDGPAQTVLESARSSARSNAGSSVPAPIEGAAAATASASSADSVPATQLPSPPLPGAVPTGPSVPSFYPLCFHGEFVRGLKHGPGVLKLSGKGGYWRGRWFQGVQHGVHLLVEPPLKKGQAEDDVTPTAWLFDRGVKVRSECLRVSRCSVSSRGWFFMVHCSFVCSKPTCGHTTAFHGARDGMDVALKVRPPS